MLTTQLERSHTSNQSAAATAHPTSAQTPKLTRTTANSSDVAKGTRSQWADTTRESDIEIMTAVMNSECWLLDLPDCEYSNSLALGMFRTVRLESI